MTTTRKLLVAVLGGMVREAGARVRPEAFGADHWSTFGYAECRVVDNQGELDREHMRCDPIRHPGLRGRCAHRLQDVRFPTRLADGILLEDHDDYDCLDDLEKAGLLSIGGTGLRPIVSLTELGHEVAGKLRAHKAKGGRFATFRWEG